MTPPRAQVPAQTQGPVTQMDRSGCTATWWGRGRERTCLPALSQGPRALLGANLAPPTRCLRPNARRAVDLSGNRETTATSQDSRIGRPCDFGVERFSVTGTTTRNNNSVFLRVRSDSHGVCPGLRWGRTCALECRAKGWEPGWLRSQGGTGQQGRCRKFPRGGGLELETSGQARGELSQTNVARRPHVPRLCTRFPHLSGSREQRRHPRRREPACR